MHCSKYDRHSRLYTNATWSLESSYHFPLHIFFHILFFEVPCVFVYRGIPHPKLKVGGGDAATMGEAHPDKIFLFWLSDMLVQSEYYKSDAVHKLLSCFPFFCHNYQHAHVEMSKSRRLLFPLIKSSVVYSSVRVSPRRHEENQAEELG